MDSSLFPVSLSPCLLSCLSKVTASAGLLDLLPKEKLPPIGCLSLSDLTPNEKLLAAGFSVTVSGFSPNEKLEDVLLLDESEALLPNEKPVAEGLEVSAGLAPNENPPTSDFSAVVVPDDPKENAVPVGLSPEVLAPKENPPPSPSFASACLVAAAVPNEKSEAEGAESDLADVSPPKLNPPPLPNVGAGFSTVLALSPDSCLKAEKSDFVAVGASSAFVTAGGGGESFFAPKAKVPKVLAGEGESDLDPKRGVLEGEDFSAVNDPNIGAGAGESDLDSDTPKAPKFGLGGPEL